MAGLRYPRSDHCDGRRFFNPGGLSGRSFFDLPKWWWQRAWGQGERWPARLPETPRKPSPPRPSGGIGATFVGHATFLLEFDGVTVLTDPVFSRRAGPFGWGGPARVREPGRRLEELPRVDVVLVSHNHYDHCDLASLRWLMRRDRPQILTFLGLGRYLEERGIGPVHELDWWDELPLPAGVHIVGTPAQHWSSRTGIDRCRTLWGGFMIRHASRLVFFCGDSGYNTHFAAIRRQLGAPDLALLPIGAYEPRWFMEVVHMNPDEAVRAHLDLGATRSLGMHFGTFPLTDEGVAAPVAALNAAREVHRVPAADFATLDIGETYCVG